ncbi:glyoxalase [Phytohabitans aurantiacus]|uniref:Glyoxalase n=2 Tax=Phytohabitans aurantiacus TaxID=3016789 RepID=A0ABQ5QT49_9ACTN|nr:glyoxalase [Phytohabitans aurantiacus]
MVECEVDLRVDGAWRFVSEGPEGARTGQRGVYPSTEGDIMNWTLEVVVVPVSDVDRAKAFYADQLGFNVDHDTKIGDGMRIVQLTPPGSGCSIVISKGMSEMAPGSLKGLQLVVADLRKARAELVDRGVDATEIQLYTREGTTRPARDGDDLNNEGFVHFTDPDGNAWAVQQISARD